MSAEGRLYQWDPIKDTPHLYLRRRRANELTNSTGHSIGDALDTRHPTLIKEAKALLETETIPQFVWPAAIPLCLWISTHRDEFEGKSVLELGSGVGVGGMAALSTASPKVVVLSDCSLVSLAMMTCTLRQWVGPGDGHLRQLKNSSVECAVAKLQWGHSADLDQVKHGVFGVGGGLFDVVIGSDVFYFQKSLEDGLTTAHAALKTGGKFLCGSFVRSDRMEADLERVPSLHGFELGSVSVPASEEGWSTVHGEATEDDLAFRLYTWIKL